MLPRLGAPPCTGSRQQPTLAGVADAESLPDPFARAVASLRSVRTRPEISLAEMPAPHRLAPYTFALSAHVNRGTEETATGRLIVLYDPEEQPNWCGSMRIVTYVAAELDPEIIGDPLFAEVGWAWLIDALGDHGAEYTAVGGTVTQISSTRFGELGEPDSRTQTTDAELRASWTPLDQDLHAHLDAWCTLLASTAGLPPLGVAALPLRLS